ncbi:MAG TPA: hypothetical protein VN695_17755 [Streptosporangiaceae bacterium]|nr:hypothetical protein [Streptosporangiaceae bacterium]
MDRSGWTAFKDPTASPFDTLSEAADKLRWMDRRAMRREGATNRVHSVQPFPGSLRTEQHRAKAEPLGLLNLPLGARQLRTISGKYDRPPERYVRVDPLRFGHANDLAHRVAHRPIVRTSGISAMACGHYRGAGREQRGTPSAIASRRAEAGDLGI